MNRLQSQLEELDALQSACINCGLCMEVCPIYQETGWEQQSPRGRIRLARDLMDGKFHPSSPALQPFDQCRGCAVACMAPCPTRVNYLRIHGIVEEIRDDYGKK